MPVIYYTGLRPYSKWWLSALLLPIAVYLLTHPHSYTVFDYADLIIHESGHFFFMFLGRFMHFLGGTLMQLIFPALLAFYFFANAYRTGVQLFVFWLGQNCINISVYAADAVTQRLPLLGDGLHDWHYMLGRLDMLQHAGAIGTFFMGAAALFMLAGILTPLFMDNDAVEY